MTSGLDLAEQLAHLSKRDARLGHAATFLNSRRAGRLRTSRPCGLQTCLRRELWLHVLLVRLLQLARDVGPDRLGVLVVQDHALEAFAQDGIAVGNVDACGVLRLRLRQLSTSPRACERRTYADLASPDGLAEVARYADGIGVHKDLIVPAASPPTPTTLIHDAHAHGLQVHVWTLRAENYFLLEPFRRGDPADPAYPGLHGDFAGELTGFLETGIDGFFTDFPDLGAAASRQS